MCSLGNADGSLAFAILIELLFLFPIIILAAFYVLSKVPRSAIAWLLFISGPALIVLAILTLAILAGCHDVTKAASIELARRAVFAQTTGIRALLLGLFLTALIFVNKFLFHGSWTFQDSDEHTKPASSPDSTPNYHPPGASLPYSSPPQTMSGAPATGPPPPQAPGMPQQPQYGTTGAAPHMAPVQTHPQMTSPPPPYSQ